MKLAPVFDNNYPSSIFFALFLIHVSVIHVSMFNSSGDTSSHIVDFGTSTKHVFDMPTVDDREMDSKSSWTSSGFNRARPEF